MDFLRHVLLFCSFAMRLEHGFKRKEGDLSSASNNASTSSPKTRGTDSIIPMVDILVYIAIVCGNHAKETRYMHKII